MLLVVWGVNRLLHPPRRRAPGRRLSLSRTHARPRLSLQMSYETLRVYQLAMQFLLFAAATTLRLPRGNRPIPDQLRRTSASVCLNTGVRVGWRDLTACLPSRRSRYFAMRIRQKLLNLQAHVIRGAQ